MAPVGTLWGRRHQPQTKIILSVAALNELELEEPEWHFFNKPPAFTSKFHYGKIPTFEGSDGFQLTEGVAIARYLSMLGTKVNLLGSDAKEISLIEQWIHFADQEVGRPGYNIMSTIYGFYGTFNREALDQFVARLIRALNFVEAHLATCPSGYLVSGSVTLADFVLAGMVLDCSQTALGAAERAKYPNVFAHYARVTDDPRVKQFWGPEGFTEVAITSPKRFPHA